MKTVTDISRTDAMAAVTAYIGRRNAEGRPIWKPMHMQPIYHGHKYVTAEGISEGNDPESDIDVDIFRRGLCLPSDNKMTTEEQDGVIEIIHRCFR